MGKLANFRDVRRLEDFDENALDEMSEASSCGELTSISFQRRFLFCISVSFFTAPASSVV